MKDGVRILRLGTLNSSLPFRSAPEQLFDSHSPGLRRYSQELLLSFDRFLNPLDVLSSRLDSGTEEQCLDCGLDLQYHRSLCFQEVPRIPIRPCD